MGRVEAFLRPLQGESDNPGIRAFLTEGPMAPGTEWVLFAEGVRVGALVADSAIISPGECSSGLPGLAGRPLLIPQAQNAVKLLALPRVVAKHREFGPYRPLDHTYPQRVASLDMAREIRAEEGAAWPNEGFLSIRRQITVFRHRATRPATFFAATFALGDALGIGPAEPAAYSLFVMGGERADGGYRRSYSRFRSARDGKAVPSYFDKLDLDGDGSEEVLLRVFGERDAWWSVLGRRGDSWVTVFEEPCPAPGG